MKFNVPDMSCGHCKASVETAIRSVDESATIDVDLTAKTVDVISAASAADLATALASKGFPATSQPD
jgi:copper chaperone